MIGWYVDAGYFDERGVPEVTNISQITFLDSNKPITAGTILNSPLDYRNTSNTPITRNEMSNAIMSSIGDDYYKIYTRMRYYNINYPSRFDDMKSVIPSFDLSFPNTYNFFKSIGVEGQYFASAIRFKKLNLLLYSGGTVSRLFQINKDGSLKFVSSADFRFVWIFDNSSLMWPLITDYSNTTNFKGSILRVDIPLSGTANTIRARIYDMDEQMVSAFSYILSGGDADFEESIPPYGPGGDSGPTQPDNPSGPGYLPPGTFDDASDAIPDSSLPTLSAANTGFTRIYNPTLAQVQDLARYLWTDETVVQTIWNHIKQYFEDPMQAIIGFNLVPCAVPNAGSQSFALMYIDTGVTMNVAANQFVDVDCGTVKLERYYGSALDQSPYTRVSCFLPFIGTVRLNTDEVMGTTLRVKYRIDICSGSCVAKVLVDENVIYQYSGHCAINIPISSADFSSYVSSAITVARLAIGAGVAGAAGIGSASVSDPEQQTNRTVTVNRTTTTTARNPNTGRQITTGTRTVSETRSYPVKVKEPQDTTQASFNALSPENISNTAGQIMASKPSIEHSGSFSGNTGYLGVRRPYLLIERPNMCMPEQYQHFNGFPAMITMQLSECKGFTRVHQVQLTGMSATNPEQAEILSLLKSGVYFSV